jgi:metacaspase-1
MKKALLCGVNHFPNFPDMSLGGCVNDALSMQEILNMGELVTESQVTKDNVIKRLTVLVEEAKAGDLKYLGFAFSSHGTHYPDLFELDGLGEALVCYDISEKDGNWDQSTIIKDKELQGFLNQVPPSCMVEVWLDTCYSGGMDRLFGTTYFKNRYLHNPGNTEGQTRLANTSMRDGLNPNIVMWQSSSEAQTSADAFISDKYHGAFTWFWTQEFKKDSKMSRVELLVKTRKALQKAGYNQFPRLKCWNVAAQRMVGT